MRGFAFHSIVGKLHLGEPARLALAWAARHNMPVNTDALRRPAASPLTGARRRLPSRYVAWPARLGSRWAARLRAGSVPALLAHALQASRAPAGRSRLGGRVSSELGLALVRF
jgi:hypothetical protein